VTQLSPVPAKALRLDPAGGDGVVRIDLDPVIASG
jgi:hypothetical protein